MSDDDLIRRGDAERAARQARTLHPAPGGGAGTVSRDARDVADEIAAAIRALPTVARPACMCCRDAGGDCQGGCACRSQEARARDAVLPAVARESEGCVVGNCSQRPLPPSRTVAEALAEAAPSPPTCATCLGSGMEPCPYLQHECRVLGHEKAHRPCPACAGGRRA